jgi:hypothetical protein
VARAVAVDHFRQPDRDTGELDALLRTEKVAIFSEV